MSKVKKPEVKPKRAVILRGVPGSGKSTYARLAYKQPGVNAIVISVDDVFFSMKENQKIYNPLLEEQSHKYCQTAFLAACQTGERLIVVDDFNTSKADLEFYEKVSEYFGYKVEIVRFSWREPPENWRKLSRKVCEDMQGELNKQYPKVNEKLL